VAFFGPGGTFAVRPEFDIANSQREQSEEIGISAMIGRQVADSIPAASNKNAQ